MTRCTNKKSRISSDTALLFKISVKSECLFVIQTLDVYGTWAFRRIFNIEFYAFAIFQALVGSEVGNIVSVDKNVFSAVVRLDKSKSFC